MTIAVEPSAFTELHDALHAARRHDDPDTDRATGPSRDEVDGARHTSLTTMLQAVLDGQTEDRAARTQDRQRLAAVEQSAASTAATVATMDARLGKLDTRMGRLERMLDAIARRLDVDVPPAVGD